MARKKRSGKKRSTGKKDESSLKDILSLYSKLSDMKRQLTESSERNTEAEDRLAGLEIHINLLTRLLTTLCIEKFGMRIGVLRRLVKRIEKEAVRDSQILELESLYRLSHESNKKQPPTSSKPKEDPWDKIS